MHKRFLLMSLVFFCVLALVVLGLFFQFRQEAISRMGFFLNTLNERQETILASLRVQSAISLNNELGRIKDLADKEPGLVQLEWTQSDGKALLVLGRTQSTPAWALQTDSRSFGTTEARIVWSVLSTEQISLMLKIILMAVIAWAALASIIAVLSGQVKKVDVPPARPEPSQAPDEAGKSAPEPEHAHIHASNTTGPFVVHSPMKEFMYRFDKELSRSSEHAVDISLCIIKTDTKDGENAPVLMQIQREFVHEDLIFMVRNGLWAVILPHHDIDQSLVRLELFLRKMKSSEDTSNKLASCLIGISSRNGRLVDAKRIFHEAYVALKKAHKDHGQMVGFRADPTKYRNFLTHQKV